MLDPEPITTEKEFEVRFADGALKKYADIIYDVATLGYTLVPVFKNLILPRLDQFFAQVESLSGQVELVELNQAKAEQEQEAA